METISTDSIETFDSLKLKLNIFFPITSMIPGMNHRCNFRIMSLNQKQPFSMLAGG